MASFSLKVLPLVSQWNIIREQLAQLAMKKRWTDRQLFDITLICEEWFMNIVEHGQCDAASDIVVEVEHVDGHTVKMLFSDAGIPFAPFEKGMPALAEATASVDQRLGGLGIHFIQNKISDYEYCYRDGRNCVTMFYSMEAADEEGGKK